MRVYIYKAGQGKLIKRPDMHVTGSQDLAVYKIMQAYIQALPQIKTLAFSEAENNKEYVLGKDFTVTGDADKPVVKRILPQDALTDIEINELKTKYNL